MHNACTIHARGIRRKLGVLVARSRRGPPRRGFRRARRTSRRRRRPAGGRGRRCGSGSGSAKRARRRSGAAAHSARMASSGRRVRPKPSDTSRQRVARLAARRSMRTRERSTAQAASAWSARQWPSSRRRSAPGSMSSGWSAVPWVRSASRRAALPASRKRSSKSGVATRSASRHRQRHHRGVERAFVDLLDQRGRSAPRGRRGRARGGARAGAAAPAAAGRARRSGSPRCGAARPRPRSQRPICSISLTSSRIRRARRSTSRPVGVTTSLARAALDQPGAERRLQLADLHRERRLADVDRGGGAAEWPASASAIRNRNWRRVSFIISNYRNRKEMQFPLMEPCRYNPRKITRRGRVEAPVRATSRRQRSGKMDGNDESAGKCPVVHGATSVGMRSNRDWWPNQLNLRILHQHSKKSNPMGEDFDYAKEFKTLDLRGGEGRPARADDRQPGMVAGRLRPLRRALHPDGLAQRRHLSHRRRPRRRRGRAAALRAAEQLAGQRQPRQGAPAALADQAEVRQQDLLGGPDHPDRQRRAGVHGVQDLRLRRRARRRLGAGGGRLLGRRGRVAGHQRQAEQPLFGRPGAGEPAGGGADGADLRQPGGAGRQPRPAGLGPRHPRDLRADGDGRRGDGGADRRRPHLRQDPRRGAADHVGREPEGAGLAEQGLGWTSSYGSGKGGDAITWGWR